MHKLASEVLLEILMMSPSTSSSLLLRRSCESGGGMSRKISRPAIGLGLEWSSSEMSEPESSMSDSLFEVETPRKGTIGRHFLRIRPGTGSLVTSKV